MNWAFIGASTIASQYMVDAVQSNLGKISYVVSSSKNYAESFAKRYGISVGLSDIQQALSDISVDAVYISSTNEKHYGQAIQSLNAGKHVLCEKPLALSLDEVSEMEKLAKQKRLVLATNHHLRNAGSHLAIKSLIDGGEIGKVLSIRIFHAVHLPKNLQGWRINSESEGGGVILDIVVHDADTVRFYLGEDPKVVSAIQTSSELSSQVEDSVMSVWEMPSGVLVQTHESFTHPYAGTGIEIHGDKGSIFAKNVNTQEPIGEVVLTTTKGNQVVKYSNHNLYHRSVKQFMQAIKNQGLSAATAIDGIKSLAVALAVKQAATTKQHINVDYRGY